MATALLNGLPERFDGLISALDALGNDDKLFTFEFATSSCEQEDTPNATKLLYPNRNQLLSWPIETPLNKPVCTAVSTRTVTSATKSTIILHLHADSAERKIKLLSVVPLKRKMIMLTNSSVSSAFLLRTLQLKNLQSMCRSTPTQNLSQPALDIGSFTLDAPNTSRSTDYISTSTKKLILHYYIWAQIKLRKLLEKVVPPCSWS